MNLSSVQHMGVVPPWRNFVFSQVKLRPDIFNQIQIGAVAAVLTVARLLFYEAAPGEIAQRPLDRAAREMQVFGDGVDTGPAGAAPVRSVFQVHVDRLRAVRDVLSVNGSEITHTLSSCACDLCL